MKILNRGTIQPSYLTHDPLSLTASEPRMNSETVILNLNAAEWEGSVFRLFAFVVACFFVLHTNRICSKLLQRNITRQHRLARLAPVSPTSCSPPAAPRTTQNTQSASAEPLVTQNYRVVAPTHR